MAAELICEIWCDDEPPAGVSRPWLHWSLTAADLGSHRGYAVALGPADRLNGAAEPVLRSWRCGTGADADARIVLAWLRGNALADRLGIDTDLLVQLFIEATTTGPAGVKTCDGEYLSTITGTPEGTGTAAGTRWRLTTDLTPELTAATLDAIADSDPRWRYAIVAAQDPQSPAGRVRQALLDDLTR